jgi:uncharacterized membrane protein YiaA
MQGTGDGEGLQSGGVRDTLTGTGGNYGPAAAHAASMAPPVLFFFIGAWIYGFLWSSFIVAIALMLACWGSALYMRGLALKKDPSDTYSAFQYKQAVAFTASAVGIVILLNLSVILSGFEPLVWLIAIGYTFYGAYQVARGKDFRYPIIGKRLSA